MKNLIARGALALALFALIFAWPAAAQDTTTAQPPPEVTSPPPQPEPPSAEDQEAARQAAEEWLAYIDAGDAAQSYDAAAQMFKEQIAQEDWERQVDEVQSQIGELQSRSFVMAQAPPVPPDAPQGKYLAVQYASDYANASVQETIVLFQEGGDWKMATYLVSPAAPMPAGPPDAPSPPSDTTGAASDTTGNR